MQRYESFTKRLRLLRYYILGELYHLMSDIQSNRFQLGARDETP
jgi:hypothetical protein